jgi:hypothetical protein
MAQRIAVLGTDLKVFGQIARVSAPRKSAPALRAVHP